VGLALFFASVAVNAVLGIYAVLAPDFGETQGKILGTSLCVTGAVLIALACEPAWERNLLGLVPPAAATLGALGFVVAIAGIWTGHESETWTRVMATIFTLAAAGVVASLLALARVSPRHEWLVKVTFVLLGVGAVLYGALVWIDDPPSSFLRALGVAAIALAAFTVTVPVVHWIDRGALAAARATLGTARFCPYCGRELAQTVGADLSCTRCGRDFRITSRADPDVNLT
jgi:hypothetical protein